MSRSKTELWHRILTHYLPLYFPEADRFHRSSRTDWFLAFLEMFPSPHMISALTKEEFTKAAWEVVGRKVEKTLMLSDIYETAKASAGLPVAPDSDAIRMFRMMLAEGRSLIRQRNAIEDRAVELLGGRADYQLLRTIPGIGPINALTILAETGEPMLRARLSLRQELAGLERRVRQLAKGDPACRRMMSMPGVGAVVALTYRSAVDDPRRFTSSKKVGPWAGLTPSRNQSGERDVSGGIT